MNDAVLISALTRSLLAGELSVDEVLSRAARTLGHAWRWLKPLVARFVETFSNRVRPDHREVVQWLQGDDDFRRMFRRHRRRLTIAEWISEPHPMRSASTATSWNLPVIQTSGDLADWLSLYPGELEWFADLHNFGRTARNEKLSHYRYRLVQKRSGGVRLIESPKGDLKAVQRRILAEILDRVPAHPSVHGFVKGRSIVSFASPHRGRDVVLRIDLDNFFPSFPTARAQAIFRMLGYPETVADRLAGICTNSVPRSFWPTGMQDERTLYERYHLPQGAPTSPMLANIAAYGLDCRLSAFAAASGAAYTRYADDLAFSGDAEFKRCVSRFADHVAAIAMEEGFAINHHKTRIMRQGVRQQLAGVVVNRNASIRRDELKVLEAMLTNCVRRGPASQNRESHPNFRSHLEGRIGFVEMINRDKGRRLRAIFESIRWD